MGSRDPDPPVWREMISRDPIPNESDSGHEIQSRATQAGTGSEISSRTTQGSSSVLHAFRQMPRGRSRRVSIAFVGRSFNAQEHRHSIDGLFGSKRLSGALLPATSNMLSSKRFVCSRDGWQQGDFGAAVRLY